MIELDGVYFRYSGKVPLIQNISFNLARGGVLGLLGHNGSGKSTLMKLIAGLMPPEKGKIKIFNRAIQELDRSKLYHSLSMMIEEPALYSHLSIWDNLRIRSLYYNIDSKHIDVALNQVNMQDYRNRKASKLSTGMKQRVGLAAALLPDPDILLLDEPTNGMDPKGIIEIRQMINSLSEQGKTLIVSSHLLSEIEKVAREVMILRNGECVFFGSINDIKGHRDLESFYISHA
jgi:ABC-type multidrug transport system ATPase subunit